MQTLSGRMAALATLVALQAPLAALAEDNPVRHEPRIEAVPTQSVDVIIKLRREATATAKLSTPSARTVSLAKRTGVAIEFKREISQAMLASRIVSAAGTPEAELERLRADPQVEYVALDRRRYPQATVPNDALFSGQWYLQATQPSAINAIGAWDQGQGTNGVVVAVLDTGVIYDHPDLGRGDRGGKLLPGYDFVSGIDQANDDTARDANPSDPGDWILSSDQNNPAFFGCLVSDSSWHGTRVAGMIGALSNNGVGVAGLSWNSFILPVRVLGKCGGTDSDIIAGMRWAAGLHVNGVPDNTTPARILNMSLGATSPCEPSYLDVIQELTEHKVLVVISAGNEGTVVSSPANCPGVAAIAAIRHAGSKVGFSNLGPEVAIAAPGGNCVNVGGGPCLFSLDTTSNTGTTNPGTNTYTNQTNFNLGTSFSAPIVSGVAALMLAENFNLSTAAMLDRLREGARPFPLTVDDAPNIQACHVPVDTFDVQLEQCLCTTEVCGAGMVDAANSVTAAGRPIAAIAPPDNLSPGQPATFDASASTAACGRTVAGYAWRVVSPAANPPPISGSTTANATIQAPVSSLVILEVTVTDDLGRTDSAQVIVMPDAVSTEAPEAGGSSACAPPITSGTTPTTPTTNPPNPSPTPGGNSGGGGGGGSFELFTLMLLGVLVFRRASRRVSAGIGRCI